MNYNMSDLVQSPLLKEESQLSLAFGGHHKPNDGPSNEKYQNNLFPWPQPLCTIRFQFQRKTPG